MNYPFWLLCYFAKNRFQYDSRLLYCPICVFDDVCVCEGHLIKWWKIPVIIDLYIINLYCNSNDERWNWEKLNERKLSENRQLLSFLSLIWYDTLSDKLVFWYRIIATYWYWKNWKSSTRYNISDFGLSHDGIIITWYFALYLLKFFSIHTELSNGMINFFARSEAILT